jgi:hypothetical protein
MTSGLALALRGLTSSEASNLSSYNSLTGVKLVALGTKVLWLHAVLGSSSARLAFDWSSMTFFNCEAYWCIHSLRCYVGLGVIDRSANRFDPHLVVEKFEDVAIRLLGVID